MIAVQAGAELGFTPMRSLASMKVISGRAGPMTNAAKALILQAGVLEPKTAIVEWVEGEGDELVAYCKSHRRGYPEPITHSFSWKRAVAAGLPGRNPNYKTWPERMLAARARGFHFDDVYPDVLMGMTIAEVLPDLPPADATDVVEIDVTPPAEPDPLLESGPDEPDTSDEHDAPFELAEEPPAPEPPAEDAEPEYVPPTPEQLARRGGPVQALEIPDVPPSGLDDVAPGQDNAKTEAEAADPDAARRAAAKKKQAEARKKTAAAKKQIEEEAKAAEQAANGGLSEVQIQQVEAAIMRRSKRFIDEDKAAAELRRLILTKGKAAKLSDFPAQHFDAAIDFIDKTKLNLGT